MGKNNDLNGFEYSRVPKPVLIKELPNGSHIYGLTLKEGVRVPRHTGPGDVYIIMSEGVCKLTIEEEVIELEVGDLFHFDGNRVHELEAMTNLKAIVVTTFEFGRIKMI